MSATRWLLLDYGQVLCLAPPTDEWDGLRRAAGYADADRFHRHYWKHRLGYDRGDLTAPEYWAIVAPDADLATLIERDVAMWLHPDPPAVEAAARAGARGWQLALFSNAPVEVAAGIDALDWLAPVGRRFFSCPNGRVKPEPEAYLHVLEGLGAPPDHVTFFDDRQDNLQAAAHLGIRAHLFADAAQIDAV